MSITEVAKAAGVSTATVSRVLNQLPGVRSETVKQVRAVAEAMNYRPRRRLSVNPPSPRLATRTGNIAVITLGETPRWLQLPVMAAAMAGIQRGTSELGLRLILEAMPDPTQPCPLIEEKRIDGAVVFVPGGMGAPAYETLLESLRRKLPVVWAMGMPVAAGGVDHVTTDNIRIGQLACSHLLSLGCSRLAYLAADPAWSFLRLRGQAFVNAAYDAGQSPTAFVMTDDELLIESYGRNVVAATGLHVLVEKLLEQRPRPDGLFVANDATVANVYMQLNRQKVRIGKDLHIVSCDNEEARLASLHPRPASIDIGAEEVGYRCVLRLRTRLQRQVEPPLLIQVYPTLVVPDEM